MLYQYCRKCKKDTENVNVLDFYDEKKDAFKQYAECAICETTRWCTPKVQKSYMVITGRIWLDVNCTN